MKKVLLILACGIAAQLSYAQATPKWAGKAKKAVFSIVTYDKDNKIKNTGNGFYINENGTALSDYTLFEGAERAVIINADSKELPVLRILGANSMYDIVKFNTETDKKTIALKSASQPASVGETVYLLPYSTQKAATCQTGTVTKVDTIGDKAYYYTLAMTTNEKTVSCPIMNANGEVLGLIQKNASDEAKESYAIGATYGASLSITALSLNDMSLNKIGIKKGLPETEDQALVYLFMASSQQNQDEYITTLNDFLEQYPNSADGYIRRATTYMGFNDDEHNALADADLKKALEVTANKSETQYNIAKLIYSYTISLGDKKPYGDWSYDKALSIIHDAMQADNQPIYTQLEGDILFAMKKYPEAYAAYEKVKQSSIASAATFYSAAKTKQLIEGTDMNEVIALMDSAVARFTKPYTSEAAPYFYERAEIKAQTGKYREAVIDYDTFYDAIGGRVTAAFYLQREQAEIQCKMYQQAINDINKAVEMTPEDVAMWVEKGSVHLRVGQHNEAIEALEKAISLDPKAAAAYRMLGYCQIQLKKNKEACANFAKAKELGDEVVDGLIQKYCK
ncbi:tetratricopeptide repeat protein [Phocaeicola vulgatus]|jgi:tetratricopeptide (TPR) repeat protein|uniref:Tetratricopeptide repeat protein n=1 Tax=Phocaeicola vulgatus TaxID=821 RepID=A0A6I1A3R3_PHOVU|nr:serine protease [Phocaeicola vulgatus]KAB6451428.1 tetratricopeptide repeat protein [Phocaeicola vulgatus]KAB6467620.1 tetratricopeptide repeat protein [Phocaeicola vulgatus]KAB6468712.1 tetratricopeptide repeat protein [Phocaeicola vulgatus]KAB6473395.1 tetratricopeptide repeat protein [Phocaeicola vulgatus]KAB6480573.1 tetratricopeptide repeat protein [Phocaeicola vulgatus]